MAQPRPALSDDAPAPGARSRLTRDEVLDAHQVADLLHLPPSTVLDYARRDILPAHKLGRRWIFLRDEIEARVRHAPSHNDRQSRQEPAARHPPPPTRTSPKRYPEAVPADDSARQRTLFC